MLKRIQHPFQSARNDFQGARNKIQNAKSDFGSSRIDFQYAKIDFQGAKTWNHQIPSVPFVSQVNGRAEMNRQHFEVAKIFREIDPRRGGEWVLIVLRGILICDIDWDKSGLRNLKNQNLKFPSAGTRFQSAASRNAGSRCGDEISLKNNWNRYFHGHLTGQ